MFSSMLNFVCKIILNIWKRFWEEILSKYRGHFAQIAFQVLISEPPRLRISKFLIFSHDPLVVGNEENDRQIKILPD